ncbi:MAG TPA: GNAT family N-acetyltransferase [Solirubrobacteraceae bacterium]|nr:GNAT family N-acetyltransferase [Solirubrobacteraceae bacterium]
MPELKAGAPAPVTVLRRAREDDVTAVLDLWRGAGPSSATDTREGLIGLMARDRDALRIAEMDGEIVGTLIAAWDGWRGSMYKLVVHPDHRRRGLAKQLVREAERKLHSDGAVRLTAVVVDDDPAAMSLWKSVGYERQAHRARFVKHI